MLFSSILFWKIFFSLSFWLGSSLEKTLMLGGIGARGEGDDRGWDGWMASLTWWTWVWVNSGSWWWTGRPGVLRFMGSQRVGHNWATELNWRIKMIKSAPKNICLKTCPTRFPGAQSVSLYPELPQGLLKVNSYSSMGFNLPRGT